MEPITGLSIFLLLCIAAATFAKTRGRSWWLTLLGCALLGFGATLLLIYLRASPAAAFAAGVFVPLLSLVHTLVFGNPNVKQCPHCAERIKAEATRCKHCGADLADVPASA